MKRPWRAIRAVSLFRLDRESRHSAWSAFVASRVIVWLSAVFAILSLGPPLQTTGFNPPVPMLGVLHPFAGWRAGGALELLFAPLSQWDAGEFLAIVDSGYHVAGTTVPGQQAAFFPLYPLLVKGVSAPFGGSLGASLIAAYAVSLACFLGALYLLAQLTTLELGADASRATVLLLAVFPGSLYFSAPYSESLFLLTSVAAFYAARRGHWAWAGVAAGLASGTRAIGLVLIVPLLVLYLFGPREDGAPVRPSGWRHHYPLRPNVLWLGLTTGGFVAYSAYLKWQFGDWFTWATEERVSFARVRSNPWSTAWAGAREAWRAIEKLRAGLEGNVPVGGGFDFEHAQAALALMEFSILCLVLLALIATFRRLPLAYGTYVLVSLLVILSSRISTAPPIDIGRPLQSLHRFVAVLFPLFMWLGAATASRRLTEYAVVAFAIPLGVFTAMFALHYWLV